MKTLKEKRNMTLTECPVFALQIRDKASSPWECVSVFFDPDEARNYCAACSYRYDPKKVLKTWRIWAIPASGDTMRYLVRLTGNIESFIEQHSDEIQKDINRS